MNFRKILIIQTAYIGDAILITPLLELLSAHYPEAVIDIFINSNNQSLFQQHPKIRHVWAWNKRDQKYRNLRKLAVGVRQERYDLLINCHRYASSGVLSALSKAKVKIGFDKNPFSSIYNHRMPHQLEAGGHEVDRNLSLLRPILPGLQTALKDRRPVLYPAAEDYAEVLTYQEKPYLCIAPASIWFTKQFPAEKWVSFLDVLPFEGNIYLLGGKDDIALCESIAEQSRKKTTSLAGKLSLLQSAALMQQAMLNYVNDSAPLHLASALNAPVCAVYCSTVTDFGFYPLSDFSAVVEVQEKLACRPCGSHGHRACPEGHFKCALDIDVQQLLRVWQDAVQYASQQPKP